MITPSPVYQGQFGDFTIDDQDRRDVILYRTGLGMVGLSVILGTGLILRLPPTGGLLQALTALFALFSLGLGLSLWKIHIYLVPLHRLLQTFWAIGTATALLLGLMHSEPLLAYVYHNPSSLWGLGFSFAALTGIFFKEAFCFNRLETKCLTPLLPILILGHLFHWLTLEAEQILLALLAGLLLIFVVRKSIQPIPPDIGDKSVFTYLKQRQA
ncbi:DUF2301 domain-containing membrane protein [Synechocystis sp. LKSZ1]|uniref:DUF2301 domain-containing membrane protein n=1 Tax=Synechocystis sp. LKSZ1 TaxID=3144951 RepID=UPI00336C0B15